MIKKIKKKLLFTPGPLNTSVVTKQSTLIDLGSRDREFVRINKTLFSNILKFGKANKNKYLCIPIQGSGTFGLEATFTTLLNNKSKILILSNGVYGNRLISICKKIKKKFTQLKFKDNEVILSKEVERFLLKDKSITHLAMVHCETSSGILNPLNEIASLSKKYKKKLIIDAMSTFGGVNINLKKNNIDVLISSANKCLESIPGLSFSIIKKNILSKAKNNAKTLSLDMYDQWKGFLKNDQWRFTPPTHSVIALFSAVNQLKKEGGVNKRSLRYKNNYITLVLGMKKIGFQCFVSKKIHSHIIVSFNIPRNLNFNSFYNNLSDLGFVIYPGSITNKKTFRIGCIGNIYPKHIKMLLNGIKKTLKRMNINHLSY